MQSTDKTIAIIGAGPAGLACARWLAQHGHAPVLLEAAAGLGGQWNAANPASATWTGMRTNTSRVMSAFSDLDHAPDVPAYPSREQMLAYLERYAARFDLVRRIRFGTRVERLEETGDGAWRVHTRCGGVERVETFRHVVVATGAQAAPVVPQLAGLHGFAGQLGVAHTSKYDGAMRYRGRSVLVAGCSISALEIAADLASGGAQVIAAYRRQRYILPKLIAGVPAEHAMFHRAAALAGEVLPMEALAEGLKAAVLRAGGRPDQFGARVPDADIFTAGVSQSQGFLPAVAEGRIAVKPWIDRIEGREVVFTDGSRAAPDAILFGTGYGLALPWLEKKHAEILGFDGSGIDLYAQTFHPDLPGLAFIGLYNLVGPYLPVLELQARLIAYTLAGHVVLPERQRMEAAIADSRAMRARGQQPVLHDVAIMLARAAGVEPMLSRWPQMERALLFGPLSPASFRLEGLDRLEDAAERTREAARAFGAIASDEFTQEERQLRALVTAPASAAA